MFTAFRIVGYFLIVTTLFTGVFVALIFSNTEIEPIQTIPKFVPESIERGEMLAKIGSCSACHTVEKGLDFAGGVGLQTPFGVIFSTNITPDPETGIGTWSFQAFDRAMRSGLDREGRHLYPAFPYDFFSKTTELDMQDLYAYFMTREPVKKTEEKNDLIFPFSYRPFLLGWKTLFIKDQLFYPDPNLSETENHGAYLASSLGHCGACHSPRNIFGAVISKKSLQGGTAEGWDAPALGKFSNAKIKWREDDYANYLFDGWSEQHGIAAGSMTPVTDHLYDADEDDVYAISAWLAALTPKQSDSDRESLIASANALDWPNSTGIVFEEELPNKKIEAGRDLFLQKCSKCHKQRVSNTQPVSLALTFTVNAETPQNLYNVIKRGIQPPIGSKNRKMEPIDLKEEEFSLVAAYVRWHFSDEKEWKELSNFSGQHKLKIDFD